MTKPEFCICDLPHEERLGGELPDPGPGGDGQAAVDVGVVRVGGICNGRT